MVRFTSALLGLLFAVAPTVDMVCRTTCTPVSMATSAPSCHEVAPLAADGVLLPAISCQRDAIATVAPAEGKRNLVSAAPLQTTVQFTVVVHVPASALAGMTRQATRPRPPQACPSTIVLRI